MLPDRVSNPGPLTYESDALPIALRGPAVRLTDRPDMTLDLYRGRKTTMQQSNFVNRPRLNFSTIVGILIFMSGKKAF